MVTEKFQQKNNVLLIFSQEYLNELLFHLLLGKTLHSTPPGPILQTFIADIEGRWEMSSAASFLRLIDWKQRLVETVTTRKSLRWKHEMNSVFIEAKSCLNLWRAWLSRVAIDVNILMANDSTNYEKSVNKLILLIILLRCDVSN